MTPVRCTMLLKRLLPAFLLCLTLASLSRVQAQPTILSVNPVNGATGVATSTEVIFTFSTVMSTYSQAIFTNSAGSVLPVTPAWNAGNTALTCTPAPSFPASTVVYWTVIGFDSSFNPLTGTTTGSFTTGSSGGGTGSGTNQYTSFVVDKAYEYDQTSAATPVPDTNAPYFFSASTTLASNRTATSITVTLPTGGVSNLTQNIGVPEDYFLAGFNTNQATFESTFPQGNYTFNVMAAASNQTLVVAMPAAMAQPNAPHVTNYTSAQAIDATKAFSLGWDPFTGGAGASNFVFLIISGSGTNVYQTGSPGASNAPAGTTTSVTIPANTLQPGSTYSASLAFYHTLIVTNNPVNLSIALRSSVTRFSLATSGGGGPLDLVNPVIGSGSMSFDVTCSVGQTFSIVYSSDPTLPLLQWSVLLTTNSSGTKIHYVDPRGMTARAMFYGARNGP